MTAQPEALRLADALEHGTHLRAVERDAIVAELRRLHDENEALKAAQHDCGFGAGCCYQAAKSEADEALLRQALEAMEQAHDESLDEDHFECRFILSGQITALRERLGETK